MKFQPFSLSLAVDHRRLTRGLRFTLTAVYTVVFTLLLIGVSLLFRQTLVSSLDTQSHDLLDQNWAVVKAYLRIVNDQGQSNYHAVWNYDHDDQDESNTVAAVRGVIFIADENGKVFESSATYDALGEDKTDVIRNVLRTPQAQWLEKHDDHGVPYLIRAGYVLDEAQEKKKFYVAIGASLADSLKLQTRFTWMIAFLVPLVMVAGIGMGWVFTGRALQPVVEVAETAQRISGSNLSLRIPSRGAGDELDRLIETFNEMIARLEVSFSQIRQFSTDVSHELRTPITIIRGQLEVALFTANTVEQYREAIINSLSDIERLSQIVRALLLLSQAETGQVVLQRQLMDLGKTLEGIVDQFQIPAEGAGVRLTFHNSAGPCPGEFDPVQIERMISNLMSNAIKFTGEGGEVRVTLTRHDDAAEIAVADTGEGIAAEHLPHIFDRFYRVRGPGEQATPEKGLGLGLSFVAWIVRAHGGTINVESELHKGTTFYVRLPLVNRAQPAIPAAPTAASA